MLLLVGLPGSGKTTFARALVTGMPWKYTHINEDTCGTRTECLRRCRLVLQGQRGGGTKHPKCPIVDLCNVNLEQRRDFVDMAEEFHVPVECVVFTYPMEHCVRRCLGRRNSGGGGGGGENNAAAAATGTAKTHPEEIRRVISCMIKEFNPPLPNRVNVESKFRTLRNVTDVQMSNDLVLEYLSNLY